MIRQGLSESKKQTGGLLEQVDSLQTQLSDNNVQCLELEGQVKHAHNVRRFVLVQLKNLDSFRNEFGTV